MTAVESRRLTAAQVLKRCEVAEVALPEGEAPLDAKTFIGMGQERFVSALELCVRAKDPRYNLYAPGLEGAGAYELVKNRLQTLLQARTDVPDPDDVCYVFNFDNPQRPTPLKFKKGFGEKFKRLHARILRELKQQIPHEMSAAGTQAKMRAERAALEEWQEGMEAKAAEFARARGFRSLVKPFNPYDVAPLLSLVKEAQGAVAAEEDRERVASPEELNALTSAQQESLGHKRREFLAAFERFMRDENFAEENRKRSMETIARMEAISRDAASEVTVQIFNKWWDANIWRNTEEVRTQLMEYAVRNYHIFLKEEEDGKKSRVSLAEHEDPFLPWEVTLLVDHRKTEGVPIIACPITSFEDAVGSIGVRLTAHGVPSTDHRLLPKNSLLHRAIGGYLVLNIRDLLTVPLLWLIIKSIIKGNEVPVGNPYVSNIMSYRPYPIPGKIRFILFGPADAMHLLAHVDDEFAHLFKVRGDVLKRVERTPEQVRAYSAYFKEFVKANALNSLTDEGMCALIEQSQRLAGDQEHMSVDLGSLTSLLTEADMQVDPRLPERKRVITRAHVEAAKRESMKRADAAHRQRLDYVRDGTILISTSGTAIGQVNGLVVSGLSKRDEMAALCRAAQPPFNVSQEVLDQIVTTSLDEFGAVHAGTSVGFPTRITASISTGKFAVVNIHKEVKLTGPSYEKADLIVQGLLRSLYGDNTMLMAYLMYTCEQTYVPVDGDSGSVAKFGAITSAVGKIPMRQDLASTGSLNLKGEVQPIGGVNEKSEGWHDACVAKEGTLSTHGVIIPHQNVRDLMLREDVALAVEDNRFGVYPVSHVDEFLANMSGMWIADYHRKVNEGFEEHRDSTIASLSLLKGE